MAQSSRPSPETKAHASPPLTQGARRSQTHLSNAEPFITEHCTTIARHPGENYIESFKSPSCSPWCSRMVTFVLTDQRLVVREEVTVPCCTMSYTEEFFRLKDLQHISLSKAGIPFISSMSLLPLLLPFSPYGLGFYLFVIGILIAVFTSPVAGIICILFCAALVSIVLGRSFCCPSVEVSVDFYRKETVRSWLSEVVDMPIVGFFVYPFREGSFTSKTIRLDTKNAHQLVQLLYGHPLTQYAEDRTV